MWSARTHGRCQAWQASLVQRRGGEPSRPTLAGLASRVRFAAMVWRKRGAPPRCPASYGAAAFALQSPACQDVLGVAAAGPSARAKRCDKTLKICCLFFCVCFPNGGHRRSCGHTYVVCLRFDSPKPGFDHLVVDYLNFCLV